MASPTSRASNIWQVEAADDILQIVLSRGPVIAGIDSTGAGFGALAGGGGSSSMISTGLNVANTSDINGNFQIVAGNDNSDLNLVAGPTGQNGISIEPGTVAIAAGESNSELIISADTGGIDISSTGSIVTTVFNGYQVRDSDDFAFIQFSGDALNPSGQIITLGGNTANGSNAINGATTITSGAASLVVDGPGAGEILISTNGLDNGISLNADGLGGRGSIGVTSGVALMSDGNGGLIRLNSGATFIGGTSVGFFDADPIAKPTVTGSKGGNAALASALTALAALGLIIDSTT